MFWKEILVMLPNLKVRLLYKMLNQGLHLLQGTNPLSIAASREGSSTRFSSFGRVAQYGRWNLPDRLLPIYSTFFAAGVAVASGTAVVCTCMAVGCTVTAISGSVFPVHADNVNTMQIDINIEDICFIVLNFLIFFTIVTHNSFFVNIHDMHSYVY